MWILKCCSDPFYRPFTNLSLPNTHVVDRRDIFFSCLYISRNPFQLNFTKPLLAMIAHSAVQSSTRKLFTMLFCSQARQQFVIQQNLLLIGKQYLAITARIALTTINLLPTFPVTNLAPLISPGLNV